MSSKACEKGIANEKEWATFQSIFFFKIPLATGAVKVSFILFRKIGNWDPSLALEWCMRDLVMFNKKKTLIVVTFCRYFTSPI